MSKFLISARLAALVIILIFPAISRAQTLADRLPADTVIYLGWRGADTGGPGFEGSQLQAVLADSNLPRVFNEMLPKLIQKLTKDDKDAAEGFRLAAELIGPMWRHPSAIAFAGVDMNNPNGPAPKVLVLCQAGNEATALKKELEDLLTKQHAPVPFAVHVIQAGDIVAVVTGYDKPEAAIIEAGAGGKSLANRAEFSAALGQVSKDAMATAYVDVDSVLALADQVAAMAGADIQGKWARARETLGLAGINRIIVTSGFDGKEWGSQGFVMAPAPRKGLLGKLLEGKPLTEEILTAIPKNATVAGAVHFDAGGLVSGIHSALAELDPGSARDADKGVRELNKAIGIDLQKDLLAHLGDEWAYYVDPAVAGNGVVGATLINRLKNPAAFEESMATLELSANRAIEHEMRNEKDKVTIRFRQARVGNLTLHYLGVPLVEPTWAVQNGNLYMGLYPEVVIAAAAHVSAKGDSIVTNPAAINLFKRLGDHPVSSFQFIDLARRAPESYSSWLVISHLAGFGDLFDVPAPVTVLPTLAKLLPRLSASGNIGWTDADGLHFRSQSPFPGAEILASDPTAFSQAQAPVLISILLPALNRAREHANRVKSAANLRQIGLASLMYSNQQKNGALPKDFATMFESQDLTLSVFVNPATNTAFPAGLTREQQQAWVNEHSDYVWNGAGKKNTAGQDEPIAWERPETATEGINILFGDGHVEWTDMARANEIIEKATQKK